MIIVSLRSVLVKVMVPLFTIGFRVWRTLVRFCLFFRVGYFVKDLDIIC